MFPIQDNVPARQVPWVTWTLIALNVLVFLQELTMTSQQLERLVQLLALVPADLLAEPWRHWPTLITSMFLHGGWMHIIGNMWTLYLFGDNVEDRMGPAGYLIFYLLSGVAAGLTHALTTPDSTVPTLGASGAVSGVLGAYLLLYPGARIITLIIVVIFPLFVELPAILFIGIWFLSQLYSGTLALLLPEGSFGGVAWWAHVGGFVMGMLLLPLFKKPERRYRRRYPDEYWPW
ncbi:MAG: rhomboid family intramembrane serine protease [Gemmataceae bacterium]|nr:rhomboid family intramembrane serine protease [Gemmataceae bacterium]MDW8243367.1 rhomboid family intramembrane serine protease [Thermogemmata sp.]